MEMPHGTHKQTTFGWLQWLLERQAARRHRRQVAIDALEPRPLRATRPRTAGLFNLAAPH